MSSEKTQEYQVLMARIITVIFHPLLMPLFGMLIVFFAPTLFGYLPVDVKKLLLFIAGTNNLLLPLSFMPFFRYRNIITSWSVEERRERTLPLLLATLLYSVTAYIISRYPIPVFFKTYFISVFLLSFALSLINLKWKISLHAAGSGALTAIVFILSYRMSSPLEWYLSAVLVISGLVMFSRLKLNLHTPAQVWSGFIAGFAIFTLSMMLLN